VNHLRRELAPITDTAWGQITEEATRTLAHFLAGRKLLEVSGPDGWERASLETGVTTSLEEGPVVGVDAALRQALPFLELRTAFSLPRAELDRADRGAQDLDLTVVVTASVQAASAEDTLVFHGFSGAGLDGLASATPHDPVTITDAYDDYPRSVARAVAVLRASGVAGPYAIALGPRCYTGVIETTEHGGYPVFDHLKMILGGPVIWAPAVDGAVVVSQRGGDFQLAIGQDLSIGYAASDTETVQLYLEESVALRINSPEAAVKLSY
jgi:uncharacterized linocin/CFP29 family protein